MIKRKVDFEKLLSISAITLSVMTLLIFIFQTNLLRKQNYISILPYLQISTSNDNHNAIFELNLKNHGVGPAIIESVTMTYDNKNYDLVDYENQVHSFLISLDSNFDSLATLSWSTLDRGIAIPANTSYNVFRIGGNQEDYRKFTTSLEKLIGSGLNAQIVYKSILDERWKINFESDGPEKLE